jgi:hypothetical protein
MDLGETVDVARQERAQGELVCFDISDLCRFSCLLRQLYTGRKHFGSLVLACVLVAGW